MGKPRTDQPPGPRGRWLVGNSYDYDRDRIGFLRRNQARYGDVFSFSPSTVVVCDPSLIHEIFNRSNEIFLAEAQVLASRREMIRAEANVENWMRSRRLGWQGMTRGVVRAHGRRVVTAFDAALSGTGGEFFDVMALMRVYSGRLVADLLFGTGADDVVAAADHRSTLALPFMNTNLTIPKWLPTPGVRRAVRAEDAVEAAIENHVRQRRANPHDESEDLLDLLLAEDDPPLEDAHIVQLLESTMLASLGSPGAVLAWVVLELARHPDIRERVREEAIELLSETGSVTDDNRLPYSKAFIKEILRLYPPTWLMGRLVRRPYTLGDWSLRPGQEIMFSPYLVQRDPRWWSDPDELRPERWLEPATPESRRAYLPFGSGPRIWLGMHLALYQLVTAAAHLAAHYEIVVNNPDAPASTEVILVPTGLRARLTPDSESKTILAPDRVPMPEVTP